MDEIINSNRATPLDGRTESDRAAQPVDLEAPPRLPFPVIGVGASAGGLEAFIEFFSALPSKSGMAFVLIQHLPPDRESLISDILSKRTEMPVHQVEDGMPVEVNQGPGCLGVDFPMLPALGSNGGTEGERIGNRASSRASIAHMTQRAICKQLVELHAGTITAESPNEHGGATFVARLPLPKLHQTASYSASGSQETASRRLDNGFQRFIAKPVDPDELPTALVALRQKTDPSNHRKGTTGD